MSDQITPLVQRQTEEEGEEELLQTKQASGHTPEVPPRVALDIASIQRGGKPLPAPERAFFEPRLGHEFNQVRVHTDAKAGEAARAVHARAFTVGNHIVIGAGQYRPENSEWRRLLAHELVHVAQQGAMESALSPREIIRRDSPADEDQWLLPDVATRQAQVDALVGPDSPAHCQVDPAPKLEPIGGQLHIDIGGEGRYPGAYNLNPSKKGTVAPWVNKDIPNHVCGVGENIPVPSGTVDYLTVESTPIVEATVREIARVIKTTGHIRLFHPKTPLNRRMQIQVAHAAGLPFPITLPEEVRINGVDAYVSRMGVHWAELPLGLE